VLFWVLAFLAKGLPNNCNAGRLVISSEMRDGKYIAIDSANANVSHARSPRYTNFDSVYPVSQDALVRDYLSEACYHEEAGLCHFRAFFFWFPVNTVFKADARDPTLLRCALSCVDG
jgi:hypothetical protein